MSRVHGSCRSFLLALVCSACLPMGCGGPEAVPDPDVGTVHGAILDYYLEQHLPPRKGETFLLVIGRFSQVDTQVHNADPVPAELAPRGVATWAEWERDGVLRALEDLRRETWDAFVVANAEPQDLSRVVRFSRPMKFLWENSVHSATGDADWIHFDEWSDRLDRQPADVSPVLSFSLPGISADGKQALLYVDEHEGPEGGSGDYYLLVREGGVWKVVNRHSAWAS